MPPPLREFLQDRGHFGVALHQRVRPGAVLEARCVGLLGALVVLGPGDVVLLAPRAVHDAHGVHVLEEDRAGHRSVRLDLDRVVVGAARLADRHGEHLEVGAGHLGAGDREHHIVGGHRRAVVEDHALADVEPPERRIHLLPRRRERGDQAKLLVAHREALEDLVVDEVVQSLVLAVGIGREKVALRRPAEGLRARRRRRCENGEGEGERGGEAHSPFCLTLVRPSPKGESLAASA